MPLDEQDIGKLRQMLGSSAWRDVMQPRIENRLREKIKTLTLHRAERSGQESGTALRGAIEELQWMLLCWQNEVTVFDHNRRVDELHEQAASRELAPTANP